LRLLHILRLLRVLLHGLLLHYSARDFNFIFLFKRVYQGLTSARGERNIKIEKHPVRSC